MKSNDLKYEYAVREALVMPMIEWRKIREMPVHWELETSMQEWQYGHWIWAIGFQPGSKKHNGLCCQYTCSTRFEARLTRFKIANMDDDALKIVRAASC
jgi:hypothetical protein